MAEGSRPQVSSDAVREALARVLVSHEFRTSKRSQEFLRYVVEHTLSGQSDLLKERTIGIEVFGRSTDYEPGEDATVRVKAGEVRKRLGLYYAEQGSHDSVRIELPLGTYVPEFRSVEVSPPPVRESAPAPTPPPILEPVPAKPKAKSRGPWVVASAALLCFVLAGIVWLRERPANTPIAQFWGPVLSGNAPVLLCAAYVPVYGMDKDAHPTPRPDDFVLMTDQFVG